LLPSGPGGIQQELVVKDLPAAKIQKKNGDNNFVDGLVYDRPAGAHAKCHDPMRVLCFTSLSSLSPPKNHQNNFDRQKKWVPLHPQIDSVAQPVEQRPFKPWVLGSNPSRITRKAASAAFFFVFVRMPALTWF
jgi:hypothetical protein